MQFDFVASVCCQQNDYDYSSTFSNKESSEFKAILEQNSQTVETPKPKENDSINNQTEDGQEDPTIKEKTEKQETSETKNSLPKELQEDQAPPENLKENILPINSQPPSNEIIPEEKEQKNNKTSQSNKISQNTLPILNGRPSNKKKIPKEIIAEIIAMLPKNDISPQKTKLSPQLSKNIQRTLELLNKPLLSQQEFKELKSLLQDIKIQLQNKSIANQKEHQSEFGQKIDNLLEKLNASSFEISQEIPSKQKDKAETNDISNKQALTSLDKFYERIIRQVINENTDNKHPNIQDINSVKLIKPQILTPAVKPVSQEQTIQTIEKQFSIINQFKDQVSLHQLKLNTEITMKLHPQSLGDIKIKLIKEPQNIGMEHSTISAKFQVSTETVKNILESNFNLLKDSLLNNSGLSISSFTVDVQQENKPNSHNFNDQFTNHNASKISIDAAENKANINNIAIANSLSLLDSLA